MEPILAELTRGGILEARFHGLFAEANMEGDLLNQAGDPNLTTTLRSSAKPLQAIPLTCFPGYESLNLTDEELAICCASHPGTERHSSLAASALSRTNLKPEQLVCGPAGEPPSPFKHGCSGNHTAIALTSHLIGAAPVGYENPDHPAQKAFLKLLCELAGTSDIKLATDGCNIPTFGLRLRDMARAYASLGRNGAPWRRISDTMGKHPELIGDETWIDVRLMNVTKGRIVAKTGAEGLLCLTMPGSGRGMAIKMLDGSTRALGAVTLEALLRCGWIYQEEADAPLLRELRRPVYRNREGVEIASIAVKN